MTVLIILGEMPLAGTWEFSDVPLLDCVVILTWSLREEDITLKRSPVPCPPSQ